MYNYDHEIEMPKDKAMRKFLWDDYFHDSAVRSIAFQEKGVLRITLVSCLDQEEAYARIKGTEAEKREYLIKNEDKFVYYLYFENVFHFSLQKPLRLFCPAEKFRIFRFFFRVILIFLRHSL